MGDNYVHRLDGAADQYICNYGNFDERNIDLFLC